LLFFLLAGPGCSPVAPECKQPEVFCIGLVTQEGRADDRASNQAAWDAILQAKSKRLANKIASIETIDYQDYVANTRVFAKAGYDVVVTLGDDASPATYTTAGQYPAVYFIGSDQHPSADENNVANLVRLVFRENQLGFLAGAMAAAMTQTCRVGTVCGSDAWLPMKLYGDRFLAGAIYINHQVKATVSYHNEVGVNASLNDPVWGEAAATSLIDEGADTIFATGGSTGSSALEAEAARGAYVIGAEIDQYYALPAAAPHMLTSILKLTTPGVLNLLRAVRGAQDNSSLFRAGIYFGQIDYASFQQLVGLSPKTLKSKLPPFHKPSCLVISILVNLYQPPKIINNIF
jgi:Uncharacterized ABC-type transport system, periplasmic component/surface lipoprotein